MCGDPSKVIEKRVKKLSFSRSAILPPFLFRTRLCDEQCLRSPTALITNQRNFNASQGGGGGTTNISTLKRQTHRSRAKAPFSHRSWDKRKATPAVHQGTNLNEEAEPPKEHVDPKRFSWLKCEPLPLPQIMGGRGAVPTKR